MIDWVSLPSNVYGVAIACLPGGTFNLQMNKDRNWYTGTDQNPEDRPHYRAVTEHEFGHATGGWLVGHWNQTVNADPTLCENTEWATYHTMCSGINVKNSYRWNTLEVHDIHTFSAAY